MSSRILPFTFTLLAVATTGTAADQACPNVLFLAIDDLRSHVGVLSVAHAKTPPLDAFARTARVFSRHYVHVPTCGASRCALLRGLVAVLLTLGSSAAESAATAPRPNIVLILADNLGHGDLACNNPESKIPTPCADRLAPEGRRFTDAHSPSADCTATRCGFSQPRKIDPATEGGPPGQLYHLGNDPAETRNLHDAMPEKVRVLSELLTQIRNQEQGR